MRLISTVDELSERSPQFKPPLDDPESALRNAKKARLNQAIAQTTSTPRANGVHANGIILNGHVQGDDHGIIVAPVFDDSDLLDADAEGEVEDAIEQDLQPGDDDMDAEGELDDADAEGEVEEMELS